jgi:hypothetical protein
VRRPGAYPDATAECQTRPRRSERGPGVHRIGYATTRHCRWNDAETACKSTPRNTRRARSPESLKFGPGLIPLGPWATLTHCPEALKRTGFQPDPGLMKPWISDMISAACDNAQRGAAMFLVAITVLIVMVPRETRLVAETLTTPCSANWSGVIVFLGWESIYWPASLSRSV